VCFSDPQAEDVAGRDYQHHGRVDVNLLRMQLPIKPYHFYICGPSPMMESLVPALEDWGVRDSLIHFEAFGPASIKRRNIVATAPCDARTGDLVVTFAQSGKKLAWPTASSNLLEFAEASGVSVNSGCRAGGCGSCQTTILSGEVSYHQPPDFDPEPGTCLLCVCTPKTSLTLEA
jgi:ferredoxin